MIRVLDPGFLSTMQDRPRFGLGRYGLSEAGPMAPQSFAEANWLAGNDAPLPTIEVTVKPVRLLFLKDAWIGLAGADFGWKLDGRPVPPGQSVLARSGSTLHGDYARNGMRGYVAVPGGFAVPRWQGSAAVHVQSGFGGAPLKRGEELPVAGGSLDNPRRVQERPGFAMLKGGVKILRVVPGPQKEAFGPESLSLLSGAVYRVLEQSNRMALRMEGLSVGAPSGELPSSGAWQGAVQIPPGGVPQVLGPEHPATGGYAVLATVIRADWEVMGQLRPREDFRFGQVSLETAAQLWQRQQEWLKKPDLKER
jgi:antagonist of KipI